MIRETGNMFWMVLIIWMAAGIAQGSKLAERESEVRDAYGEMERSCAAEISLSSEETAFNNPVTEAQECLIACVLKRAGLLRDGVFDKAAMDRITAFIYEGEPKLETIAQELSLKCQKKFAGLKVTSECQMAARLALCIRQGWKILRFKYQK